MFDLPRARRYAAMGLCVIPLKPRSKKPDGSWERFQHQRPTDADLVRWFGRATGRNAAIALGRVSSVVAVDTDTPDAERWVAANLPATPMMTQTRQGFHRFYRYPLAAYDAPTLIPSHIHYPNPTFMPGRSVPERLSIEVRRDGHYVVAPGSTHESGWLYRETQPWPRDFIALPELPAQYTVPDASGAGGAVGRFTLPDVIVKSERHLTLWKLARSLKAKGVDHAQALAFCHAMNRERCDPVIDPRELDAYLRRGWQQPDQPGYAAPLIEPERTPRPAWIPANDRRGTEHLTTDLSALYRPPVDTWKPQPMSHLDVVKPIDDSQLSVCEPADLGKLDHI